ncbi:MAG: cysteine desulfurase [Puniceicoccales bacterium]|jgi:cysteine desulfurase/selenocysteine lyase|nr:cysteine desulfurase [Puniceicoccales bacterium]
MESHDPAAVARRFPLLLANDGLVYLDNAATTHRLDSVLERISRFYGTQNSNVHRGLYGLAAGATEAYEAARVAVAHYIHAPSPEEIIFVRGTTEAINLVASCWSRSFLRKGDEILTTAMEHHSNFLPWIEAARTHGASLKVCSVGGDGELDLEDLAKKLTPRTKLLAVTHVSNVLGTVNPISKIVSMARQVGAHVVVDGAKRMDGGPVDIARLGCDFYAFSGHKMFAGMGIGVLYGRRELLERMPPYQLGGGMVERVSEDDFNCRVLPEKFEAGTPNVAGAIGLHAALQFLETFPWEAHRAHGEKIRAYLENALADLPGVRLFGCGRERAGIYSIACAAVHAHDLASMLATKNICVRAGNHCAQPLLRHLQVPATLRASFSIYNTMEQAAAFVDCLRWAIGILG